MRPTASPCAVLEAVQAFFDVIASGDAEAGARLVVPEGERSHGGTDAFNLVRTDQGWRIAGGTYSVVR